MKLFKALWLSATVALVSCSTSKISLDPTPKRPKTTVSKCNKTPVTIAVIDTGFGFRGIGKDVHLCKYGHKDFTSDQLLKDDFETNDAIPEDLHGHGTHIAGLIDNELKDTHVLFCLVILKYYSVRGSNLDFSNAAINYARQIGVDYINYSGGGITKSDEETEAVKRFLDDGGHFIAAAGNERRDLDKTPYYPAMADPRIVVVGSYDREGNIASTSSYGKPVTRWELGTKVEALGIIMSGTSQATAIATGKIVFENESLCDTNKEIEKIAQKSQ